jgi:hypothetical protein
MITSNLEDRKGMHRELNYNEIIDRKRQPSLQRKLSSHSQIDPSGTCLGLDTHDVSLRVLSPEKTDRQVGERRQTHGMRVNWVQVSCPRGNRQVTENRRPMTKDSGSRTKVE